MSLFGKRSINEIHTEIYRYLHPTKIKIKNSMNLISSVIKLTNNKASTFIDNLQSILKVNQNYKIASKKQRIIIFDDFDRIDFTKIDSHSLMGYINDLIMQKFKIVIVGDTTKIDDKYIEFKEKVFDRIYKITKVNNNVVNSFFDDNYCYIRDEIIDEFEGNLRLTRKVSLFTKNLIAFLNENFKLWDQYFKKELLFWYCTLVVVDANSEKYDKYRKIKEKENKTESDSVEFFLHFLPSCDESCYQEFYEIMLNLKIYDYYNSPYYEKISDILLLGIIEYFHSNVTENIKKFFNNEIKIENNDINKLFYYSDERKKETLRETIDKMSNNGIKEENSLLNLIDELYKYSKLFDCSDELNKIVHYIVKQRNNLSKTFFNKLYEGNNIIKENIVKNVSIELNNALLDEFKYLLEELNYFTMLKLLEKVLLKDDMLNYEPFLLDGNLNANLINLFSEKDYLLDKLNGDIDFEIYHVVMDVVELVARYGEKTRMVQLITEYKDKASEGEKIRFENLLNYINSSSNNL